MTCKFVVRLLDQAGTLLAWEELHLRPVEGRFIADKPTRFVVETAGEACRISIHWTDLDVARQAPLALAATVVPGQAVDFAWAEPVWVVVGEADVPKPTVTVRSPVTLTVPTGALAARV